MKKVFLLIMILFAGFLLASCNNKKEMEVTRQEAQQMLASVDGNKSLDHTASIKGKINLEVFIKSKDEENHEMSQTMKMEGSIDAYADLSSYENHFVYAKLVLKMNQSTTMPGIETQNNVMSMDVKIYLSKGNAYLEGTIEEGGKKVTSKIKTTGYFTQESYDDMIGMLKPGEHIEGSKNSLDLIDENNDFKMYDLGNERYELEVAITEELISNMLSFFGSQLEVTFNTKNYLTLKVVFSDRFESLTLRSNLDMNLKADLFGTALEGTLKGKISLDIKTNVSKPSGLPSQETLDTYEEGEMPDILGS